MPKKKDLEGPKKKGPAADAKGRLDEALAKDAGKTPPKPKPKPEKKAEKKKK